jgi:hypothetical protein
VLIDNFNRTIDLWIDALLPYDQQQLHAKPDATSWSIGQMYKHLIDDTSFYIEQIKACLSTNGNQDEEASPFAKIILANNDFPNEVIKGAPGNAFIPQPDTKEELTNELARIRKQMNELAAIVENAPSTGKSKHPGFNYLSGNEWLQLAEMHLRHHLRQKKRIDDFLRSTKAE